MALSCAELADNKKAQDIMVLDLREVSSITDFFVIVSGSSDPHLRAIVEEITDNLRERFRLRPRATEGFRSSGWVVLDYFDVMVHVMSRSMRDYYDLESLWGDVPRIPLSFVTENASLEGVPASGV